MFNGTHSMFYLLAVYFLPLVVGALIKCLCAFMEEVTTNSRHVYVHMLCTIQTIFPETLLHSATSG